MVILALDDEKMALESILDLLREAAPYADVHAFSTAQRALDFAAATPVDVALLDIEMPGMKGTEVAKRLKKFSPNVNIIFTTAYSEYAIQAIELRSSGYLMKPILPEKLKEELENLRNPLNRNSVKAGLYAKTFGSFDLFLNNKPIPFAWEKSKEALAYLIDRKGSTVTRKELAAVLFEDKEYTRSTQAYLTQIIGHLRGTLEGAGIRNLLVLERNAYGVRTDQLRCDAYDYLRGDPEAMSMFTGEYMNQYSWAEESFAQFYS